MRKLLTRTALFSVLCLACTDDMETDCYPKCNSDQSCQNGICVDIVPTCNPACRSDQVCQNGICVDIVPTCNPACRSDQVCQNGICVDIVPTCNPACRSDQVCQNGICVDIVPTCNPACRSDQKCENGTCINLGTNPTHSTRMKSGSRLKTWGYKGADGSFQKTAFYDTALSEVCHPGKRRLSMSETKSYCVPSSWKDNTMYVYCNAAAISFPEGISGFTMIVSLLGIGYDSITSNYYSNSSCIENTNEVASAKFFSSTIPTECRSMGGYAIKSSTEYTNTCTTETTSTYYEKVRDLSVAYTKNSSGTCVSAGGTDSYQYALYKQITQSQMHAIVSAECNKNFAELAKEYSSWLEMSEGIIDE